MLLAILEMLLATLRELLFLVVLFVPWEIYAFVEYTRWKTKVADNEFHSSFRDWYYGSLFGTRPMSQAIKEGLIVVMAWIPWAFITIAFLG